MCLSQGSVLSKPLNGLFLTQLLPVAFSSPYFKKIRIVAKIKALPYIGLCLVLLTKINFATAR